ncbi:trypsin-like peptidase domain-containing protein [Stigmatella aurantiaca]|uniref:Protease n=1 Tax=Stigmatella aurantiaca (strain DW4/3-1) TaxID=378806 RepID=Q095R8_STIAD|nr:trypsin-like peptidase domain-containing protein [Stigmatella aurantiaca]ADO72490.1 Protease [Stigmatella aurantiaca DW4/3-1]EAU67503.1 protease do [Stigmatella aurantiaca DW4/3-1]
MRHHVLAPFCLLFFLAFVTSAWAEGGLNPWLQARSREHAVWMAEQEHRAEANSLALWRERPAGKGADIPEFVPPTSLAPLIRAVEASVVRISTLNAQPRSSSAGRSTGSGFVLTPDGLVVTNNHVVARAQSIDVGLSDGREFPAEVVGRDASTDVALLRLRGVGPAPLPAVYLGDSDRLEVGDWVVAIGNPFGLDHSVSHGMISAKERVLGVDVFDDFIQTDALINPGNSGGPLFNMRGEVVGVNTAIMSQGQGIGFAVPINLVKDLLPNLRENGRLERGWLGVDIDDAHAGQVERYLVVRHVYRRSPAAEAGIRSGDQVLAVNGKTIDSYLQLLRKVALLAPGTETKLTLMREGAKQEVSVKLAARPAPETLQALASPGNMDELGLMLKDLSPEVAASTGNTAYSGALVTGVVPRSAAAQAGVTAGDVITEVNRRRVKDVAGVRAILERGEMGPNVLLRVQRGDVQQYLALAP